MVIWTWIFIIFIIKENGVVKIMINVSDKHRIYDLLVLRCKIITPVFMTGAHRKNPELRPSEFKGMMRFWWRAIKAESNIDKLKKEEAQIFGGVGPEEGKSKIWLRVEPSSDVKIDKYSPLPHKNSFLSPALYPDSRFLLRVILDRGLPEGKYEEVKNLLVLTFILGGFGKRSRRGFGSILVEDIEKHERYPDGTTHPISIASEVPLIKSVTLKTLLNSLNAVENSYEIHDGKIINKKKWNRGPCYPWITEIRVCNKTYKDWRELLKVIGEASSKNNDSSLGDIKPRFASPIYASVIRIGDEYTPIVTILQTCPPARIRQRMNVNKQRDFIEEICRG